MKTARIEDAEIAALAHRYYEEERRPQGKAAEHWARAEQELRKSHSNPLTGAPKSETALQQEKERDTQASGKMG